MCDECHCLPHRPGCPNAPAADPSRRQIYVCDACDGPILEGERYLDVCGVKICEFCIDANTYEADYDEIE